MNILAVLIGICIGLLAGQTILIVGLYLKYKKNVNIASIDEVEEYFKPKGAVILPKTDAERRRDELIKTNDDLGIPTKLSDL